MTTITKRAKLIVKVASTFNGSTIELWFDDEINQKVGGVFENKMWYRACNADGSLHVERSTKVTAKMVEWLAELDGYCNEGLSKLVGELDEAAVAAIRASDAFGLTRVQ